MPSGTVTDGIGDGEAGTIFNRFTDLLGRDGQN